MPTAPVRGNHFAAVGRDDPGAPYTCGVIFSKLIALRGTKLPRQK